MTDGLSDTPASRVRQWQERLQHLRGRFKKIALFAFGVLASLLALMLCNLFTPDPEHLTKNEVEETVVQTLASATQPSGVSSQVYQAILPSLVTIHIGSDNNENEKGIGIGFGIGSGVIINDSADILTALHIVDDATEIQVSFADGTRSSAIIATEQRENDIAVLTPAVPPNLFLPATIGSSGAMRVGDEIFAVGNPLGLTGSMSAGVISGFCRRFKDGDRSLDGLVQFDAAVNPGNSGGPLLNRRGQVIGIVTGLVNPTDHETFIGIGFAVPINVAAAAAGGPAQ